MILLIYVENKEFYTLSRFADLIIGKTYLAGNEPNPFYKEFETFTFPEPILLNDAPNVINEFSLYVRERLFEDIRLQEFPDLPSRMSCLWLMSEEQITAKTTYWLQQIPDSKTLYRISCTGKIHVADDSLLIHPPGGYFEAVREHARLYWNGVVTNPAPEHQELLFAGSFTVLEETAPLSAR